MKSQGDQIKLRSRIVILRKSGAFAKCEKCGAEVDIPVILGPGVEIEDELSYIPDVPHYVLK